jgi:hypothetical protein
MTVRAQPLRVVFLCFPSKAYGEINVVLPLAESVASAGGEVWFLASPLAARVARQKFPNRVFETGWDREENQRTFWRLVKKYRANVIVFSELYEILQPRRRTDCPFFDARFFIGAGESDATFVFLDFIAHVPVLREIGDCATCARRFGGVHLRNFFERLWVLLPCPLNEPSDVPDRSGIPYSTGCLPVMLDPQDRLRVRKRFLGESKRGGGILIVRAGSTWQAKLATEYGIPLYDHLTELLGIYLKGISKSITLVTVSDQQQLRPDRSNRLQVVNLKNLPPADYDRLILSADMVFTDNQIGYTLAKTIGNVPGVVFVNSYTAPEILGREEYGTPLWRLVSELERKRPGSIYPHNIFPLPAEPWMVNGSGESNGSPTRSVFEPETIRLGRMQSSPYVKVEIFGGKRTSQVLQWLLDDPSAKQYLRTHDRAYIDRLNEVEDGATVLSHVYHSDRLVGNTVW